MKQKQLIAHTRKTNSLKKGVLEGVASAMTVERDGELILPSAFEKSIPAFLEKNPVMLWNHDPSQPIGRVAEMWVEDDQVPFKAHLADTPKAQEIAALYRGGTLNSVSVGFMPLAFSDDEADKLPGQKGVTITELELYELSAVAIPSNRDALARMKSASLGVLSDISGYKWASDLAEEENVETPEASDLLASLGNAEVMLECAKRLDIVLSDEVPEDIRKHLNTLRLQLIPILDGPTTSDKTPSLFENLGLDSALSKVRDCTTN